MTSEQCEMDAVTEQNLAKAVDGMGVLKIAFPQNSVLEARLGNFATDLKLQRSFVAAHVSDVNVGIRLVQGIAISHHPLNIQQGKGQFIVQHFHFTENPMIPLSYVNLVYDAVITLGVSACQKEDQFFNGSQLLHSIRNMKFEGSSGLVSLFDNVTGTRDEMGLEFTLTNVLIKRSALLVPPQLGQLIQLT
jgi:hypothetical protein